MVKRAVALLLCPYLFGLALYLIRFGPEEARKQEVLHQEMLDEQGPFERSMVWSADWSFEDRARANGWLFRFLGAAILVASITIFVSVGIMGR